MQRTSMITVMNHRHSCRHFQPKPIPLDQIHELQAMAHHAQKGPFGTPLRMALHHQSENGKVGTYGTIRGAQHYLVGTVQNGPRAMEDFGHQFHRILLHAEALGLGTCWLGGTFSQGIFSQELREGEFIPAVSPIGIPAEGFHLVDQATRFVAQSHKRLPEEKLFFSHHFSKPISSQDLEQWHAPLFAARLAPSASNRQPWRFSVERHSVQIGLHRHPMYGAMLKTAKLADLQRMDIGIAMCQFEFAAREQRIPGNWSPLSSPINQGILPIAEWKVVA
ncbi:MAG: hypothetical protein MI717_01790 [Spirochaetales bacterium]|nr:hypothetical protein [Spirochaetales bacterium]